MAGKDDVLPAAGVSVGKQQRVEERAAVAEIVTPYPGPRPFRIDESFLFFGRDRETAQVRSLILGHALVLLYAQSGAGKTSMLNAAVIPEIRQKDVTVFPLVRIQPSSPVARAELTGINPFVGSMVANWAQEQETATPQVATLVDFVRSLSDFHGSRANEPRVLIIDQFEELFTQFLDHWQLRGDFFVQLQDALGADPNLRVLLAMREDYLAQTDPYGGLLENRLQHRFRIERLRRREALVAITGPLKQTDRYFAPGAAEYLVEQLLQIRIEGADGPIEVIGEFVEPVQLQIVCSSLWEALRASAEKEVTKEHIDRLGQVDRVLARFYGDVVRRTATQTRTDEFRLRRWCESNLITSGGTRALVYRGSRDTEGMPNGVIDVLEAEHLIRGEERSGAHWYELSHDKFVGAIQSGNRRAFEDHAAGARRRWRLWGLVGGLTAALGLVSLVVILVFTARPAAVPLRHADLVIVRLDSRAMVVTNRGNAVSPPSVLSIQGAFIRRGHLVRGTVRLHVPMLPPTETIRFGIYVCGEVVATVEVAGANELRVVVPCLPDLLIWRQLPDIQGIFGGPGGQAMAAAEEVDGTIVAMGHDDASEGGDAAVWTSSNGTRWTRAMSEVLGGSGEQRMDGAAVLDGELVAVGSESSSGDTDPAVWTSADRGATWRRLDAVTSGLHETGNQAMRAVIDAPPGLVAVGRDTPAESIDGAVWMSEDGTTWVRQTSDFFGGPGHEDMVSVTNFGEDLVVVGFGTTESGDRDAAVWVGSGGQWTRIKDASLGHEGDQQMNAVLTAGPGLVAVGFDASEGDREAAVWTSSDGRNWERVPSATIFDGAGDQAMYSLTQVGSVVVAGGSSDTATGDTNGAIWLSADGADWTRLSPASKSAAALAGLARQRINSLVMFGRRLLAVGSEARGQDDQAAGWITDRFRVPSWRLTGAPTIAGFRPSSGRVGTSVTITGTGFTGATSVQFNGAKATTYVVVSSTQITATIPSGAATGKISVTTPGGTATSSGSLTVIGAPTIASFRPTSGRVGTSVTITGTGFNGATAVKFNGVGATYTVESPTQIRATVPSGAATGKISVTTPGGTAISSGSFTVTFVTFAPTLVAPIGDQAISQNDPTIGCPFHPTRGYGFRILFDWTDSSSDVKIEGYTVFAEHEGATFPLVNTFVPDSQFVFKRCNSFVSDPNLEGWRWRVRARDVSGTWGEWSPFASFSFEACRIDGSACSA